MTLVGGKRYGENQIRIKYGNSLYGRSLIKDSNNCYIRSERLTVGLGLENIAVIETRDAILVEYESYPKCKKFS